MTPKRETTHYLFGGMDHLASQMDTVKRAGVPHWRDTITLHDNQMTIVENMLAPGKNVQFMISRWTGVTTAIMCAVMDMFRQRRNIAILYVCSSRRLARKFIESVASDIIPEDIKSKTTNGVATGHTRLEAVSQTQDYSNESHRIDFIIADFAPIPDKSQKKFTMRTIAPLLQMENTRLFHFAYRGAKASDLIGSFAEKDPLESASDKKIDIRADTPSRFDVVEFSDGDCLVESPPWTTPDLLKKAEGLVSE